MMERLLRSANSLMRIASKALPRGAFWIILPWAQHLEMHLH
jgi:hypothetical protein